MKSKLTQFISGGFKPYHLLTEDEKTIADIFAEIDLEIKENEDVIEKANKRIAFLLKRFNFLRKITKDNKQGDL